jgi:phosphoenolpyruvate carboxylase
VDLYETCRFADIPDEDLERAASAEDVARIVEKMVADLEAHPTEWENHTLDSFLDALARCLDAQRQLYANTGRIYPASASWTLFAESLVAATGYE